MAAISTLERVVRAQAAQTEIGTPASTELLTSLDALTSGRRARTAAASRQIPSCTSSPSSPAASRSSPTPVRWRFEPACERCSP